jgi:hypothetical protein
LVFQTFSRLLILGRRKGFPLLKVFYKMSLLKHHLQSLNPESMDLYFILPGEFSNLNSSLGCVLVSSNCQKKKNTMGWVASTADIYSIRVQGA